MDSLDQKDIDLSIIPLRELVTFPSTIVPLLIGRQKSIDALRYAVDKNDGIIFLSVQQDQLNEEPDANDIFDIGIIAGLALSFFMIRTLREGVTIFKTLKFISVSIDAMETKGLRSKSYFLIS